MSRNGSYDTSDVLNSSFYSSTSINTLDHAKTFRNSLILADLEGPGYNNLTGQTSQHSEEADEDDVGPTLGRHKETTTMKMSTSPSLSALAGILNEKSRQANEKLKSSELYGSATMEEEEDVPELGPEKVRNNVTVPTAGGNSPNLFELNDNEEVYCPGASNSNNPFTSLQQPDFLSSPKPPKENVLQFSNQKPEDHIYVAKQRVPEAAKPAEPNVRSTAGNGPRAAQRTVSASVPAEQTQPNKKKKNFFSFLKRRHSTDILATNSSAMTNSTTFSSNHSSPFRPSPEGITTKSHSSNSIFSTFRKNKEVKKELEQQREQIEQRERDEQPTNDQRLHVEEKTPRENLNKPLPKRHDNDISKRKPTPLHYEHLQDANQVTEVVDSPKEPEIIAPKDDIIDPIVSKLDTGEVLFPRSLDKHEVDSIVSIERSRSTKSNKRSSVASHRRSLTETLSVNAQNEGMFVMEASSVVLSTPDLSKSPASSILRNGRFDPIEFSSTNSLLQDDQSEQAFSGSSTQNPLLVPDAGQNRLSMASIEERLNELTVDSEDEVKQIKEEPRTNKLDEDPEFMSDIMEFASIINFGEGVNFDFDSKTNVLEPEIPTCKPIPEATSALPKPEASRSGLGISYDNAIPEDPVDFSEDIPSRAIEEDEFENEDFNTLGDVPQQSPRLKAFIPEFETNRPISMSFRGLKAPSFNTSLAGSSATDSIFRADHKSLASSDRRQLHNVNFSSKIILYETYGEEEYDRKPDVATCNQLTPQLAQLIKAELNELKSDMEVHEESQCYTHFF